MFALCQLQPCSGGKLQFIATAAVQPHPHSTTFNLRKMKNVLIVGCVSHTCNSFLFDGIHEMIIYNQVPQNWLLTCSSFTQYFYQIFYKVTFWESRMLLVMFFYYYYFCSFYLSTHHNDLRHFYTIKVKLSGAFSWLPCSRFCIIIYILAFSQFSCTNGCNLCVYMNAK